MQSLPESTNEAVGNISLMAAVVCGAAHKHRVKAGLLADC
jgi:hypothetical protein